MIAQRQLMNLRKHIDDASNLKMPPIVLSMVRAEYEADVGRPAQSDHEAVTSLLEVLSQASVGETRSGFDGGGGTRVRPPALKPPDRNVAAWQQSPPLPLVDFDKINADMTLRAATVLVPTLASQSFSDQEHAEQAQAAVLRSRLQEYLKSSLPAAAVEQCHQQFRAANGGRPAVADREALTAVARLLEQATASTVAGGWDGGGGARVFPPRPHPPPPKEADVDLGISGRPLDLGAVPVSLLQAVGPSHSRSGLRKGPSGGVGGAGGIAKQQMEALTPHLELMLKRLDAALEPAAADGSGGAAAVVVPQPVLEASRALFVARQGKPPPSDAEALRLARSMMEEAGVRRPHLEEATAKRLPALPPPPLPPRVLRAAVELDTGDAFGPHELAMASPEQLRALYAQVDAALYQEALATMDMASAPVMGELPTHVRSALEAEFRIRVGADHEAAEPHELHQLAKQLVTEAEEARKEAQQRYELKRKGSKRWVDVSNPFESIGRAVSFAASPFAEMPIQFAQGSAELINTVGGFGFEQKPENNHGRRGDEERESVHRPGTAGSNPNRGSLARDKPTLMERADSGLDLMTAQHLASRKAAFDSQVRGAIAGLRAEPDLIQRLVERAPSCAGILPRGGGTSPHKIRLRASSDDTPDTPDAPLGGLPTLQRTTSSNVSLGADAQPRPNGRLRRRFKKFGGLLVRNAKTKPSVRVHPGAVDLVPPAHAMPSDGRQPLVASTLALLAPACSPLAAAAEPPAGVATAAAARPARALPSAAAAPTSGTAGSGLKLPPPVRKAPTLSRVPAPSPP